MAKETFYFSHDYNARNDEKILELRAEFGAEGYGVFWMIVETMAENENGGVKASLLGGLSLGYGVAKWRLSDILNRCVELGLFYEQDGNYFSKRLLCHKEIRKSFSDFGREGAEKRWGGYKGANGVAMAGVMQRKGKERKEKEKKEKEKKVAVLVDLDLGLAYFDTEKSESQPLGEKQKELVAKRKMKVWEIEFGEVF